MILRKKNIKDKWEKVDDIDLSGESVLFLEPYYIYGNPWTFYGLSILTDNYYYGILFKDIDKSEQKELFEALSNFKITTNDGEVFFKIVKANYNVVLDITFSTKVYNKYYQKNPYTVREKALGQKIYKEFQKNQINAFINIQEEELQAFMTYDLKQREIISSFWNVVIDASNLDELKDNLFRLNAFWKNIKIIPRVFTLGYYDLLALKKLFNKLPLSKKAKCKEILYKCIQSKPLIENNQEEVELFE